MDLNDLSNRALEIRGKYVELEIKKYGKQWNNSQIMEGLVGDVGDLMKLVMAKEGIREIENVDEKLGHELADCLWCLFVLSKNFNINLESEFLNTMSQLEERITEDSNQK